MAKFRVYVSLVELSIPLLKSAPPFDALLVLNILLVDVRLPVLYIAPPTPILDPVVFMVLFSNFEFEILEFPNTIAAPPL